MSTAALALSKEEDVEGALGGVQGVPKEMLRGVR